MSKDALNFLFFFSSLLFCISRSFFASPIGASSLLHQLKSRPQFKRLSHELNNSLDHAKLSQDPSSHTGYTVHVESEEIIIVSIVLIFWMVFIIMFIKKWGRIRHLEPCSFAPISSFAAVPKHCRSGTKCPDGVFDGLSSAPKLHPTLGGSSYHNNLNLSQANLAPRKSNGVLNHSLMSPVISARNSVINGNERHLSVPGSCANTVMRSTSVSPDNLIPFPFRNNGQYFGCHSFPGQITPPSVCDQFPMSTSMSSCGMVMSPNTRVHSLPVNSRFRAKKWEQSRKSSDPGQIAAKVTQESENEACCEQVLEPIEKVPEEKEKKTPNQRNEVPNELKQGVNDEWRQEGNNDDKMQIVLKLREAEKEGGNVLEPLILKCTKI